MKTWIFSIIGSVLGIFGVFFAGKSAGKSQIKNEMNVEAIENVKKDREALENSDSITDDDRRKQLHDHYLHK